MKMINRVKKTKNQKDIVGDPAEAKEMARLGEVWGGNWWLTDMARTIEYSKSLLSRIMSNSRTAEPNLKVCFRAALISKIEELGKNLNSSFLPGARHQNTREAQKLIRQAIKLLDEVPTGDTTRRGPFGHPRED